MSNPLKGVLTYFPSGVRQALDTLPPRVQATVEEVRIRCGRPLMVGLNGGDAFLGQAGLVSRADQAIFIEKHHTSQFLEAICRASLYAYEEQMRQGFVTLPGGHRVGLTGEAVPEHAGIKAMKHISGFNVRIAREVLGAASQLVPLVIQNGRVMSTLIASAPGCGKTTMLRDIARQISDGRPEGGFPGHRVAIADERSEIAACVKGVPQLQVGVRTDVLDGCPKPVAVLLLLRSMTPQVIVTDEIGSVGDSRALQEALFAGVTLIASVHGSSLAELKKRPALADLLETQAFERLVFLSRRKGPGTIERVVDLTQKKQVTLARTGND